MVPHSEVTPERVELYRRLLDLGADADIAEVHRRYRKAMSNFHPDLAGGDEATARLLNEARDFFVAYPVKLSGSGAGRSGRSVDSPSQSGGTASPKPAAGHPTPTNQPNAEPADIIRPTQPQRPVGVASDSRETQPKVRDTVAGRSGVVRLLGYVIVIYLALLAFAVVGWVLTALVPWMQTVMR